MKFFEHYVLTRFEALEAKVVSNQQKLDAVAAALQTATDGIRADIQALKDQVAAGEPLDFAPLESHVARLSTAANALTNLDAENPPES